MQKPNNHCQCGNPDISPHRYNVEARHIRVKTQKRKNAGVSRASTYVPLVVNGTLVFSVQALRDTTQVVKNDQDSSESPVTVKYAQLELNKST